MVQYLTPRPRSRFVSSDHSLAQQAGCEAVSKRLMPWQCRRNTLLAEARAERDIPISLDDRAEKNRQVTSG